MNYLYDPLNPAVLRLIQQTLRAGRRAGVPVAMCGEMAGNPRYTRLLLGLGLREFSVPPNALLEVKQVLAASDAQRLAAMVRRLMRTSALEARAELAEAINNASVPQSTAPAP